MSLPIRISFAAAFVLTASLCRAAIAAPTLPPAHSMRVSGIDVKHIGLDLRFDWEKRRARGTATLTLSPLRATDSVALDAGHLIIESVTRAGRPLAFTYDGGDRNGGLVIALGDTAPKGLEVTLRIAYHTNHVNASDPNNIWGSVGKGLRFYSPTTTVPTKRRQVWSTSAPEAGRYWFPCWDSPNDLRTTELRATVEKPLMVIGNGDLASVTENEDGTRTFHWKMATPYPNHLTSVVVGEYVDVPQMSQGVELHSYGYPDEKEAVHATVGELPDMLRFFSERIGTPYPFARYSQVFVQDHAGLIGHSTVSTITDNMVDDARTRADFHYLWNGTESWALASQWFGSLLHCGDWSEIWIQESFSHYFDGLYTEHMNGRDEYLSYYVPFDVSTTLGDWSSGYRRPIVTRHFAKLDSFVTDNYASRRGALVLRTLQRELGEDAWWASVRRFVKMNAGKAVMTADLLAAVEQASGREMDWFFDQWLHRMGHPVFTVTRAWDAAAKRVSVRVEQTRTPDSTSAHPQTGFFRGRVDIELDDRIEAVTIEPKRVNVFTFESAREPKLVHFDYQTAWIKEVTFDKPLDELLHQLQNDRDVLGRRWAVDQLVRIAKAVGTRAETVARIHAGLREVVQGSAYWRMRWYALSQLRGLSRAPFDSATTGMLLGVIAKDRPWLKSAALGFLGDSRDPQHAALYMKALTDSSDRVINAAAIALGKSRSKEAYDALVRLIDKPSWKSQSLISALYGLKELGDERGAEIAVRALADPLKPRWWLATPVWDHRLAAADVLVALRMSDLGYPIVLDRFRKALEEDDVNDIFGNTQLVAVLGDPRGREVFDALAKRFAGDRNAMTAVESYESQWREVIAAR